MADSFTVVTSPAGTEPVATEPEPQPFAPPAESTLRDKLPIETKLAYAMGGSTDIFGHWLYNNLKDPVYNVFLGLSPTQVSVVRGTTLLVDACAGLLFGWLSDNTRSRWGRRRPYILIGSILSGLGLPVLFMARPEWDKSDIFLFMIVTAALYSPVIASYNTPYQSLGAELTPDSNERTSVQSYKGVIQKSAGGILGLALPFMTLSMFRDPVTDQPDLARGAVWFGAICGAWMILSGILNYAFVKERYYQKATTQSRMGFRRMFADAFQCRPYLVLLGTAMVYAIPTGLVGTLGFYALNYHVFRADIVATATISGWSTGAYWVCGLLGIVAVNHVSRVIGKHATLIGTLAIGLVAFGSSWWLYTPSNPWLSVVCVGLNGFSATGLWVVLPSMCADVVDFDELSSNKRREGAYTATFSWVMKVGMMFSMLIGGPLLEASGFDAKLGGNQSPDTIFWIRVMFAGIPVAALVIALILIQFYPLGTERMREIRAQLELRRGAV